MNIASWRFSFVDQLGDKAVSGWPILIILTDRAEIRMLIEDNKFLFYGVPIVHIGELGRRMKVEITCPGCEYVGEHDDFTDDPQIVRLAGEVCDAVVNGTFPRQFRE